MEAHDQAVRRRQPALRGVPDVGDGQRAIASEVGLELPGIAEEGVVLVQQIGLAAEAADALEPGDELELLLGPGAIELGLGRAGPGQQVQLPRDHLSRCPAARRRHAPSRDHEAAGDLLGVVADVDLAGQRLVVDQRLLEPRRQAVAEDAGGDLHRRFVGAEVLRRDVGDVGPRRRHAIADLDDALALELRDPAPRPIQRRPRRQPAEVLLDQPLRFGRIEVAGDHQRQVVRRVVAAEERLDVVERRGAQVVHAADDRPRVGMAGRREVGHQQLVGAAVGRIVEALAALVLDDVALVVQLLLVGLVEQRRQAVGLDPQQRLEVGRRHGREVVGAVAVGGAVDAALADVGAHLLDQREVLAGHVRRALEHQVLEQVGEAAAARHSRSSSRRGTTG